MHWKNVKEIQPEVIGKRNTIAMNPSSERRFLWHENLLKVNSRWKPFNNLCIRKSLHTETIQLYGYYWKGQLSWVCFLLRVLSFVPVRFCSLPCVALLFFYLSAGVVFFFCSLFQCCKENEENFHFCTWRFSIEPEVDRRWGRVSSLAYSISLLFRNCNNVICNIEYTARARWGASLSADAWRQHGAVRLGDGIYKQYFCLNRRGMERKCVEKCTWLTHCDKQTCSIIRKYNKGIIYSTNTMERETPASFETYYIMIMPSDSLGPWGNCVQLATIYLENECVLVRSVVFNPFNPQPNKYTCNIQISLSSFRSSAFKYTGIYMQMQQIARTPSSYIWKM